MSKEKPSSIQVAENRKAHFEYEIIESFEAGIVLSGSEVKSLRLGRANIADAHAGEREPPEENQPEHEHPGKDRAADRNL